MRKKKVALFIDLENTYFGAYHENKRLDVDAVAERAKSYGNLVVANAYADFSNGIPRNIQKELLSQGIKMIYCPTIFNNGDKKKTLTDSIMIIDLLITVGIDTYVIATGDQDFLPVVGKLHERGKKVVLIAMKKSASFDLIHSADEFVELVMEAMPSNNSNAD